MSVTLLQRQCCNHLQSFTAQYTHCTRTTDGLKVMASNCLCYSSFANWVKNAALYSLEATEQTRHLPPKTPRSNVCLMVCRKWINCKYISQNAPLNPWPVIWKWVLDFRQRHFIFRSMSCLKAMGCWKKSIHVRIAIPVIQDSESIRNFQKKFFPLQNNLNIV